MKDLEEVKISCFGRSIGRCAEPFLLNSSLTVVKTPSSSCYRMPNPCIIMTLVRKQPYIAQGSRSNDEIIICGSKWHDAP